MTSPLRRYAFINAKLRARISKLIPENTFQRMIKSHSLEEALVILKDTPYSILEEIYQKTGDLKLGELELLKAEIYVMISPLIQLLVLKAWKKSFIYWKSPRMHPS